MKTRTIETYKKYFDDTDKTAKNLYNKLVVGSEIIRALNQPLNPPPVSNTIYSSKSTIVGKCKPSATLKKTNTAKTILITNRVHQAHLIELAELLGDTIVYYFDPNYCIEEENGDIIIQDMLLNFSDICKLITTKTKILTLKRCVVLNDGRHESSFEFQKLTNRISFNACNSYFYGNYTLEEYLEAL